jgi:hypothetical protein
VIGRRWSVALSLLVGVLLITQGAANGAPALQPWVVVPSENRSEIANTFASASFLSRGEGWAVGAFQVNNSTQIATMAQHWNGTEFQIVATPNPGDGQYNVLDGVSELAKDDVWAVGNDYSYEAQAYQTLAEHFDGHAWTAVSTPSRSSRYNALQSVVALAPDDVWAVGAYQTSRQSIRNVSLTQHFDGSSWTVVRSPNHRGETNAQLLGVDATGPDDVWAVGFGSGGTLAEHWDGSKWRIVSTPNVPGMSSNQLQSVTAIAPDDVWAVGNAQNAPASARTLVEHWNGSKWRIVPSPNESDLNNFLLGVTNLGPNDVWAAGVFLKPAQEGGADNNTLTMHWDGSSWSIVDSPQPGIENVLLGVAAAGSRTVFAVGGAKTGGTQASLAIENLGR